MPKVYFDRSGTMHVHAAGREPVSLRDRLVKGLPRGKQAAAKELRQRMTSLLRHPQLRDLRQKLHRKDALPLAELSRFGLGTVVLTSRGFERMALKHEVGPLPNLFVNVRTQHRLSADDLTEAPRSYAVAIAQRLAQMIHVGPSAARRAAVSAGVTGFDR